MNRFNFDANTIAEARTYIIGRSRQLLRHGFMLVNINEFDWGISAYYEKDLVTYQSIYILKDFRNKGLYKRNITHRILTSYECGIDDYLELNSIPYLIINITDSKEYLEIERIYNNKTTERSGAELMNHIDEGLYILEKIGASSAAKKAYCLHPIVQSDAGLKEHYFDFPFHPTVIIAAIEYRSVANEYLSNRKINTMDDIRLSPLKDVTDMLIADKMQNRKDFDLYHKGIHERSKELEEYFANWFKRLNISEEFYNMFCETLNKIEIWNTK